MKKLIVWLLIGTISAAGSDIENHVFVHEKATLTCTQQQEWLAATQFTVLADGIISVPAGVQPNIVATADLASLQQLKDQIARLDDKIQQLQLSTALQGGVGATLGGDQADALRETVDVAVREVRMIIAQVEQTKEIVHKLLTGDLPIPVDGPSSVENAQILSNLRLLLQRVDRLTEQAAVAGGMASPVFYVSHNDQIVAELTPYLEKKKNSTPSSEHSKAPLLMSQSVALPAGRTLFIDRPLAFDGAGQSLTFARSTQPQLVITKNGSLTLTNITLKDIGALTIKLEAGARLCLGDGVRCEFHEDVTFSAGTIALVGDVSVVEWVGVGGMHTVHFPTVAPYATLQLGLASLCLHNLHLQGTDHISAATLAGRDETRIGSLALCGNAGLGIDTDVRVGIVVVGRDNTLICYGPGRGVYGPVQFAPQGDNVLRLQIVGTALSEAVCTFGRGSLWVSSLNGHATLELATSAMQWRLLSEDAVLFGVNGTLKGGELTIVGSEIRQTAASFRFDADVVLTGEAANCVAMVGLSTIDLPSTALGQRWDTISSVGTSSRIEKQMPAVYHHRVQLRKAAGEIMLQGGAITEFGIDETRPLTLHMIDGASVTQGAGEVTLKKEDMIRVRGKGNKLFLTDTFVWRGTLLCEQGSELTIVLAASSSLRMALGAEHAWVLLAASSLVVAGNGTVSIESPCLLDLARAAGKHSYMAFADGVQAIINDGASLTVSGHGQCALRGASLLQCCPGGRFFIGQQRDDDIALLIDNGSIVSIGSELIPFDSTTGKSALFSCARGQFRVCVQRHGLLALQAGSSWEINTRNGIAFPGTCTEICCQYGGALYLASGSGLVLSDNGSFDGKTVPLSWKICSGGLYGEGLLSTAGGGLVGKCASFLPTGERIFAAGDAKKIIARCINMTKSLRSSSHFVNSVGEKILLTVNGIQIAIAANETVLGEDADRGTVQCVGPAGQFSITASGQRLQE